MSEDVSGSSLTFQEICTLENRIHRVEMNLMEAQHIKKKYRIIQNNLLEDSIAFESTLLKIEEAIKKQESEMIHLKVRVGAQVRCETTDRQIAYCIMRFRFSQQWCLGFRFSWDVTLCAGWEGPDIHAQVFQDMDIRRHSPSTSVTYHKTIDVLCYRQYMARQWGYETVQGAYWWDRRLAQSAWPELGRSSLRTSGRELSGS